MYIESVPNCTFFKSAVDGSGMHKFLDELSKIISEAKSTMDENETRIVLLTQPNGNI